MRLTRPVRDVAILLIVIAAGGLAYWLYTPNYPQRPAFTLPGLDGAAHSISAFDGKVVLLNFWATWCVPCRQEIPMLVKAQADLGQAGLQIVGIAIDKRKPTATFAKRHDINYPVLVGRTKAAKIQDEFTSLTGSPPALLPYSVLIDRHGRIRANITGKLNRARLNDLVVPLLDEHPSRTPN